MWVNRKNLNAIKDGTKLWTSTKTRSQNITISGKKIEIQGTKITSSTAQVRLISESS